VLIVSELLTVKEAAALLRVKERTVLGYLRTDELEGVQMGTEGADRRWRIRREALEHFIEAREKTKRKEG
jgi:excisionase family DNA binding protein